MQELWKELFDTLVFNVTEIIFPGVDATNPVYQSLIRNALLCKCFDQALRKAIEVSVETALQKEWSDGRDTRVG